MDIFRKRNNNKKYWNDKRWKKVKKLRKQNKDVEANALVFQIRGDYGLD
jgi:hypothetical protein